MGPCFTVRPVPLLRRQKHDAVTQVLTVLEYNLIIMACVVLNWQITFRLFNYATTSFSWTEKSPRRHSWVPPPSRAAINYKVFHGWGGKDKSLLDTSTLDYSQLLRFLKYCCSRGHHNISCGKKNQSSDCCATAPNSRGKWQNTRSAIIWWETDAGNLSVPTSKTPRRSAARTK